MSTFHHDPRTTVTDQERQYAIHQLSDADIAEELKTVPLTEVLCYFDKVIHQTKIEDRRFVFWHVAKQYYDTAYHRQPTHNTTYYRNRVTGKLFGEWGIFNMFKYLFEQFEKGLKERGFATSLDEIHYYNDRGIIPKVNYSPEPQPQQRNDMYPQQQPMMQQHQQFPQQQQQYVQNGMMQQPMMQQFPAYASSQNGEVLEFVYVDQNGQPVYVYPQQAAQYRQYMLQQRGMQMQQPMMPAHMQQNQMAQAIGSGTGGFFNNSAPAQQQQGIQQVPMDDRPACFRFGRQVYSPSKPAEQTQNNPTPMGTSLFKRREPEDAPPAQQAQQQPVQHPQPQYQPQSQPRSTTPPEQRVKVNVIEVKDGVPFDPFNPSMTPAERNHLESFIGDFSHMSANGRGQNAPAGSRFPENDVDYQHVEQEFRPPWPDQAYVNKVFENVLCSAPGLAQLRDHFPMLFENIRTALSKYPAQNTFIRMLGNNIFGNCESADCVNIYHLYLSRLKMTNRYQDAMIAQVEAEYLLAWYIKSYTSRHCGSRDRARDLYNCRYQPLSNDQIEEMDRRFEKFNCDNQNLIFNIIREWFYDHNQYVKDQMAFQQEGQRKEQAREEFRQSDHEQRMQYNARIEAEKAQKLREEQELLEQQQQTNFVMQQLRAGFSDGLKEKKANRTLAEQQKQENDERFDEMIASSISGNEVPQTYEPEYELVDDIAWLAANNGEHIYLPGVNPYQERMEYRKYPDGSVRYCIMQMTDAECKQARDEAIRKAAMVGDIITEESLDQNNYPKVVVQNGTVELVDDGGFDVEEIPVNSIDNSIDTKVITLLSQAENVERESRLVRYEDGTCELVEQTDFEYTPVATDHVYVTKTRQCVRDGDGDKQVFSAVLRSNTLKDAGNFINNIRNGNSKRNSKQAADLVNQLITERINDFINHEVVIKGDFHVKDFADEADGLLDRIEREVNDFTRKKVEENQNYIIHSAYCNDVGLETIVESLGFEDPKTANIIGVTQLHSVTVINQTAAELGLNSSQYSAEKSVMIKCQKLQEIVSKVFEHDEKRNRQNREQYGYGKDQYVARHVLATKDNKRFVFTRFPKDAESLGPIYFIRVMN